MTTQSHNPDKLTEWGQSEGWRLLTVEERSKPLPKDAQFLSRAEMEWRASAQRGEVSDSNVTYRTREPLPSQPDDDLSYYETELPKVIAGVRRGEKWEYKSLGEERWYLPGDQSNRHLFQTIASSHRVRLAPVPVVKWWDEAADVPVNCWVRVKAIPNEWSLVTGIDSRGIYTLTETYHWKDMPNLEHSTDLRNWSDCVKPEGGK